MTKAMAAGRADGPSIPDARSVAGLIAAEHARAEAHVRADIGALDALFDPAYHYVHGSGVIEDKPSYLAFMRDSGVWFLTIEHADLCAEMFGEAGVVTGHADVTLDARGEIRSIANRFTSSWVWRDGWKLRTFQYTNIAPKQG